MSVPASVPPVCNMGHDKQPMREVPEEEYRGPLRRDPRRSED